MLSISGNPKNWEVKLTPRPVRTLLAIIVL